MSEEQIEHKDILGTPITTGKYVVITKRNGLHVCQITKVTPKMLRAVPIQKGTRYKEGWLVYPHDTIVIDSEAAVAFVLRNGS